MAQRDAGTFKNKFEDMSNQLRSSAEGLADDVQSKMRDVNVSEDTLPDAFARAPKFISPTVHAWLDVAVTGYFAALGAWFVARGKKGAATAAFINAGMVAGVSWMTDYHGTGNKPISFKLHGTLDGVQAATAALAPVLHGFAGEPESAFFYGQAANEVAVIASTDWDAGTPRRNNRRTSEYSAA